MNSILLGTSPKTLLTLMVLVEFLRLIGYGQATYLLNKHTQTVFSLPKKTRFKYDKEPVTVLSWCGL